MSNPDLANWYSYPIVPPSLQLRHDHRVNLQPGDKDHDAGRDHLQVQFPSLGLQRDTADAVFWAEGHADVGDGKHFLAQFGLDVITGASPSGSSRRAPR